MQKKITLTKNFNRLDVCVSESFSLTRSHAQKLVADERVFVNGKVSAKPAKQVCVGDEIVCDIPEPVPMTVAAQNIPLDIVYQDDCLAVINKQRGLSVHPSNKQFSDTLVNALLYSLDNLSGINGVLRPGIVHRLDKDTTGLLVVAKSDEAHASLAKQIQTKVCHRIYVALLEGVVKEDEGEIIQPIGRSKTDRKKMAIVPDGRYAETHFQVLKRFKEYSFVRFELKTGRTHQIRVHAKFIGHPVVGDKKYGFKNQKFQLDGQLLHAETISFLHPKTQERMTFSAPVPSDFQNILDKLCR